MSRTAGVRDWARRSGGAEPGRDAYCTARAQYSVSYPPSLSLFSDPPLLQLLLVSSSLSRSLVFHLYHPRVLLCSLFHEPRGMSSPEEDYDGDVAAHKKRRIQRACDMCRRKKSMSPHSSSSRRSAVSCQC